MNFGGAGGRITLDATGSLFLNSTLTVSSDDPEPGTGVRNSASGGDITLHSGLTSGSAINLLNTSHLLSYLNDDAPGLGGTVRITSEGGDILANGEIVADRGTIIISNLPAALAAPAGATPLISLGGSFLSLRSETLQISSAGDLNIAQGEFLNLRQVTVSLSAVNNIAGGTLDLSQDGSILAVVTSGNVDITAGGNITLDALFIDRRNGGRSTGLDITIDAGSNLSFGLNGLGIATNVGGLQSGGNATVRSGADMALGGGSFVQTQARANGGLGGNVLLDAGGNLSGAGFSGQASVDGASLMTGGNVTFTVAQNVNLTTPTGDPIGLNLAVLLFNNASIGSGGDITATVGGNLVADRVTAQITGYPSIADGGQHQLCHRRKP